MNGLSAEVVQSQSLSPKSKLRGQGIHTAISLHDLRDALLENISVDQHLNFAIEISLRDSNLCTHGPNYHHEHDRSLA